jgi:predicted RNase H-like HicB family nuclease
MTKRFYPAVLERAGKGTFAVWFPDFPDAVAAGIAQEEAIAKAEAALAQSVDILYERDRALPAPMPFERVETGGKGFVALLVVGVEPPDPSERVNVYLPKSLIARADRRAEEMGMSRSSFFGFAITSALGWSVPGAFAQLRLPRAKAELKGRAQKTGHAKLGGK